MKQVIQQARKTPGVIRSDNGTEFRNQKWSEELV